MPAATTERPSEPVILAVTQQDHAVQIRLHVQPELSWFVGHFTEQPLLPGVVQTNWAIESGRRYLSLPPQFRYLSNMKFMRFILPGTQLELRLQYFTAKSELYFEYHDGTAVCASGRVGFGAELSP
jgi:3-hydroxymyristoyl/3-hydroxydecanoyl-(acyl carrier protein) dehydratase